MLDSMGSVTPAVLLSEGGKKTYRFPPRRCLRRPILASARESIRPTRSRHRSAPDNIRVSFRPDLQGAPRRPVPAARERDCLLLTNPKPGAAEATQSLRRDWDTWLSFYFPECSSASRSNCQRFAMIFACCPVVLGPALAKSIFPLGKQALRLCPER